MTASNLEQSVGGTSDDEHAPQGPGTEAAREVLPASQPLRSVFHWLGLAEQSAGAVLLVTILVLVLAQVAQRYLPGGGVAWTGEISQFAMVWLTFVMSGFLLAHDSHIAIKVVDYFLPVRVLGTVNFVGHAVIAVVCAVMLYGVFDFMGHDRGQVTAAAEIPLTFIYTVIAFGFTSTAIRGVLIMFVVDLPEIRRGVRVTG